MLLIVNRRFKTRFNELFNLNLRSGNAKSFNIPLQTTLFSIHKCLSTSPLGRADNIWKFGEKLSFEAFRIHELAHWTL